MEFTKQPDETYVFAVDFSDILATDETISSETVTAIDEEDNSDATTIVIDSSVVSGNNVNIKIKNGIDLHDYKITCIIITSNTNTYEEDIRMKVRAI